MGLFGKKKEKTVDLGERYRKQQMSGSSSVSQPKVPSLPDKPEALNSGGYKQITYSQQGNKSSQSSSPQQESHADSGGLGFMDNPALHQGSQSYGSQQHTNQPPYSYNQAPADSESPEEKRRKLTKRLMDITNQLEEISNQLYHLQQRVEVLEKKTGGSGYGY